MRYLLSPLALLGLLLRVRLLEPLLLPFLYPFRAGGVRLKLLERERDRGDIERRGERVGEYRCDLDGDGSRFTAVGVPDRVRERPRDGDRGDEVIFSPDTPGVFRGYFRKTILKYFDEVTLE